MARENQGHPEGPGIAPGAPVGTRVVACALPPGPENIPGQSQCPVGFSLVAVAKDITGLEALIYTMVLFTSLLDLVPKIRHPVAEPWLLRGQPLRPLCRTGACRAQWMQFPEAGGAEHKDSHQTVELWALRL